jgi:drug/metabolite transporter (DMT)-like permease
MRDYYLSFFVAVGGALLYHLAQKSIPASLNPFFVLILAYAVGILVCALCAFFFPSDKPFIGSLRETNWAVIAVGVAVVLIEAGFLMAYRAGWKISTAAVATNVAVTVLLIPIGFAVYKEQLSTRTIIGLIFCVLGIILVTKE